MTPQQPTVALTAVPTDDGGNRARAGYTVLVTDDDENVRELVTYKLEAAGYRTVTAADGHTAWEIIQAHRPDLVILDISMPGMDGLSVCHQMHRTTGSDDIPVIMLSSRGTPVDVDLGYVRGADAYLIKPVNPALLLERVRELLAG